MTTYPTSGFSADQLSVVVDDTTGQARLLANAPLDLAIPAVHSGGTPTGALNIRDLGAKAESDPDSFDTLAIRKALHMAEDRIDPTVIWIPEGTYRVAPDVPKIPTFRIQSSNITIEGESDQTSVLSFFALGGQDPSALIMARGGGFRIQPRTPNESVSNILFRNVRLTGNTKPNASAGQWSLDGSLTGWDIFHQGISSYGNLDTIKYEHCTLDGWRGEIMFTGGGESLGEFTLKHCKLFDSNASAISMTAALTVEDCEIWDVYNGMENFAIGAHQFTRARRCLIDINRDDRGGFQFGNWGIVHIGTKVSSGIIEDCTIIAPKNAGVFLSEAAHNMGIFRNKFYGCQALYSITLDQYPGFQSSYGLSNIDFADNELFAVESDIVHAVEFNTFAGGIQNLQLSQNIVSGATAGKYGGFVRSTLNPIVNDGTNILPAGMPFFN